VNERTASAPRAAVKRATRRRLSAASVGRIVEIDLIADPEKLRRLSLDAAS